MTIKQKDISMMKRFFYSLMAMAALAVLPSCMKELTPVADPAMGGTPVPVSFQVALGSAMTKADNTALDNAAGTFQLYVAAFSASDGSLISSSKIGGNGYGAVESLNSTTAKTITLTLSKGVSYKVVFFAQKAGAYDVNFAPNKVATFSYKSGLQANNPDLDAFFATVDVNSSTTSYSVKLTRPFAQVNVLVPNDKVPSGQTTFSSAMTVKAPTTFDLFEGKATGDVSPVVFSNRSIATAPFGKYAQTHKYVGMNFVLVPASGNVEVTSFKESGMASEAGLGTVPVKMNGRTNLVGDIYNLSKDFTFNVQIDPVYGSESEEPVDGEDAEITIDGGKNYTQENPLVISADEQVKLFVNGLTFSEVEDHAINEGDKVTAVSNDERIAKAEVVGDVVKITPVADGETVVTVTTPAFTKTDYRGQVFQIPVKVDGTGKTPDEGGEQGGDTPEPPAGVKAVTVAEFNAAEPSETQKYQLTGTISGNVNTTYGNFDLVDETGTVYVYGLTKTDLGYGATNDKSFASLGLKAGDTVTLIGYRYTYTKEGQDDKIEVMYAYYVSHTSGSGEQGGGEQGGEQGGDTPEPPAGVQAVTVAQFNAAAPSETQKYQLTGTISGNVNTTYGNFDLVDETGTVYVYGLTKTDLGYGATNDKSFASLGLKAGDTVTLIGYRYTYTKEGQDDKIEVMYAYYVSHESGSGEQGEEQGGEQGGQGSGSEVSGNTETITFSGYKFTNASSLTTVNGENVTLTFAGGTNTKNAPKYYDAGTSARMYGGNTLTISSSKKITKIEFVFAPDYTNNQTGEVSNYQATAACFAEGSFANDVWTGSSNSVVLTNNKENNAQVRIVSLKITFD